MTNSSVPSRPSIAKPPLVNKWPGERLGLPEVGGGSIARSGRRIVALFIDWAIALLLSLIFVRYGSDLQTWLVPVIFGVLQIFAIALLSGSIGHRICGMHLASLDGSWVGIWRPLIRTAFLMLVVPALIWNSDQRGIHDLAAGTMLIRTGK